ncbi:hypothetical protein SAMN02745248_02404 [Hathewaya proteolytica DSM 3090]|uniref:Phage tail tube protein n=1 Tax=Hathewaya proteolytica DSM 3090 TaxID=1121331 RepID=A0A1M6S034_9CLOT|nr:hypothetical protein [Hathewaya proteolytica]SHK37929.1 hypothetical protein SAMN02745248_02404 [Hathewaya proteolytica DSM 3090]
MATITTGVYPVFNNKFKIGTKGLASVEPTDMVTIAELETFSVSIDTNVEEWTPMTAEGWISRLATGKGFSISLSGKRCVGDAGNDYVAGLMFKTGRDLSTKFEWEFPTGTKVTFNCIVNISSAGGDSTNVEGLEFEVMSDGKPTVTPGV